jgi:hypothetical protein
MYRLILFICANFFFLTHSQNLVNGDNIPVAPYEIPSLASALCYGEGVSDTCQLQTLNEESILLFLNGSTFSFYSLLYGNFSEIGVQELVVNLALGETDQPQGDTFLMRREGKNWKIAVYLPKLFSQALLLPTQEKTLLLSYSHTEEISNIFSKPYILDFKLDTLDFTKDNPLSLIFDFKNPSLSCAYPPEAGAKYIEIANWLRQDKNTDGFLDVILELREYAINSYQCEAGEIKEDPRGETFTPKQTILFSNSNKLTPSEELQSIIQTSQAVQGWSVTSNKSKE